MAKAKSEYLNNKTFEKNILEYKHLKRCKIKSELVLQDAGNVLCDKYKVILSQSVIRLREVYEVLAKSFSELSENIIKFKKFNFVDVDDAMQEFVLICFEKIDRFDPRKGKAFNFMTTCILNHYRQLYRSARNYNELKRRFGEFKRYKSNYG